MRVGIFTMDLMAEGLLMKFVDLDFVQRTDDVLELLFSVIAAAVR